VKRLGADQILTTAFIVTAVVVLVAWLNEDDKDSARSLVKGILVLAATLITVVLIVNARM